MSADQKRCECGGHALLTLRIGGVLEPICAPCLARVLGVPVTALMVPR